MLPLNALSDMDLGVGGVGGSAVGFGCTSFFVDSRRLAIDAGFGVGFTDVVDAAVAAVGVLVVVGLVSGCVVVVTRTLSVGGETVVAGGGRLVVELTHSRLFSNSRSRL